MDSRLSLCGPRFGSIDLHRHPCPCPAVVRSDHCQHNVFFFTPHISPDSLACQLQALFRLSRPSVLLDPTLPGSADLHTGMEFSRDKSFYHRAFVVKWCFVQGLGHLNRHAHMFILENRVITATSALRPRIPNDAVSLSPKICGVTPIPGWKRPGISRALSMLGWRSTEIERNACL